MVSPDKQRNGAPRTRNVSRRTRITRRIAHRKTTLKQRIFYQLNSTEPMKPLLRTLLALTLIMLRPITGYAETTRADLIGLPGSVPFTDARLREWQPWVTEFGAKAFSEWERGLYEGTLGRHDQARQWLIKAAVKGNTPEKDALCLAYKLARGTERENPNDLFGEKKKADAAVEQLKVWYADAAEKQGRKRKLSPEEKAAFAGIDTLPDGDEGEQIAHRRLVACRNLTYAPKPDALFKAMLTAGRTLPPYALNYLGARAEEAGRLDEAGRFYGKAAGGGLAVAKTNRVRLRERQANPADDRTWGDVLAGYRQLAEAGDGVAIILLADKLERHAPADGPFDEIIRLYQAGIDTDRPGQNDDANSAFILLGLHARERLTEHFRAGRLTLADEAARKRYLSVEFLLTEAFGKPPGDNQAKP